MDQLIPPRVGMLLTGVAAVTVRFVRSSGEAGCSRVISRTLAYAIITGVLAGVYAGLVLLATQGFRVQQRVDRRFSRARYDADRTVADSRPT